jgi:hypothetical protein
MPHIDEFKCNKCNYALIPGWGYRFYVINDAHERVYCAHPLEARCVMSILGKNASINVIKDRTGFSSYCLCLDCLYQFEADLGEIGWSPFEFEINKVKARNEQGRDKKQCPICQSKMIKTQRELIGQTCPKCGKGIIEQIWTGIIT